MATDIRPIRTKRDYDAALKEAERLWGAKAGTPEGDRLDVLATLIDAYEAEHYPMDPPDPIEAISSAWSSRGSRDETWRRSSAHAPESPRF
jgi:HTH-type transcriptional regulator/antitoxin HigA